MSMQTNHVIIMAGGVGSRFWPMSTPDCPKQFIDVLGCGRTLLQLTADRFDGVCPPENIWVVTNEKYAQIVKDQLPTIPSDNILCEPCRRNTAPCIAYVSWKIKSKYPDANMVVTPSDHIVMNVKEFQRVITAGLNFTATSQSILTLGMEPSRPETGYGYIESELSEEQTGEIHKVAAFKEKPSLEVAESYVAQDNYYWNSGLFIWSASTVVNTLREYQPAMAKIFDDLVPYFYSDEEQSKINEEFPKCDNISVDYAIMEKAKEIYVFPAEFGWSDLGTWGSLHEIKDRDENNNALMGDNIKTYETKNCVVHTTQERKVVIQGLDGYIVAEKDNTLLICRLSEEQRIKEFSE